MYFVMDCSPELRHPINVKLGGYKHYAAALRKAKRVGEAHILNESRQYVAVITKGELKKVS
jgi:hypothetical protein